MEIFLIISHETTVGELGVGKIGMNQNIVLDAPVEMSSVADVDFDRTNYAAVRRDVLVA